MGGGGGWTTPGPCLPPSRPRHGCSPLFLFPFRRQLEDLLCLCKSTKTNTNHLTGSLREVLNFVKNDSARVNGKAAYQVLVHDKFFTVAVINECPARQCHLEWRCTLNNTRFLAFDSHEFGKATTSLVAYFELDAWYLFVELLIRRQANGTAGRETQGGVGRGSTKVAAKGMAGGRAMDSTEGD